MDENRIEGAAREFGGRVQDAAGGLMGDSGTQARGKINEAAGRLQNQYGAAMDEVGERIREQPLASLIIAACVGYMLGAIFHRR